MCVSLVVPLVLCGLLLKGYYTSEVRGIIRSVLASLRRREDRTFTWAETSFFERFFEHDATSEERSQLRQLIQAGRWAFVGGTLFLSSKQILSFLKHIL